MQTQARDPAIDQRLGVIWPQIQSMMILDEPAALSDGSTLPAGTALGLDDNGDVWVLGAPVTAASDCPSADPNWKLTATQSPA